jgi:hypothetical protein
MKWAAMGAGLTAAHRASSGCRCMRISPGLWVLPESTERISISRLTTPRLPARVAALTIERN